MRSNNTTIPLTIKLCPIFHKWRTYFSSMKDNSERDWSFSNIIIYYSIPELRQIVWKHVRTMYCIHPSLNCHLCGSRYGTPVILRSHVTLVHGHGLHDANTGPRRSKVLNFMQYQPSLESEEDRVLHEQMDISSFQCASKSIWFVAFDFFATFDDSVGLVYWQSMGLPIPFTEIIQSLQLCSNYTCYAIYQPLIALSFQTYRTQVPFYVNYFK